jgi:hypothetical protein
LQSHRHNLAMGKKIIIDGELVDSSDPRVAARTARAAPAAPSAAPSGHALYNGGGTSVLGPGGAPAPAPAPSFLDSLRSIAVTLPPVPQLGMRALPLQWFALLLLGLVILVVGADWKVLVGAALLWYVTAASPASGQPADPSPPAPSAPSRFGSIDSVRRDGLGSARRTPPPVSSPKDDPWARFGPGKKLE